MYRSAANVLKTDDVLDVGNVPYNLQFLATEPRIRFGNRVDGWDFSLYRESLGVLKTLANFDCYSLLIYGTSVITSSRVLQNVTADASIIASGVFGLDRIPVMDDAHIPDVETLSYGGAFATAQIPNLDASKITSGVFASARIPWTAIASDLIGDTEFLRNIGSSAKPWLNMHLNVLLIKTDIDQTYPVLKLSSLGLEFGAGGASALDVRLYRSAADVLKTGDNFDALALRIGGTEVLTSGRVLKNIASFAQNWVPDGADTRDIGSATAEILNLYIGDAGKIFLGLTQDVNLYRSAADVLMTDDHFRIADGKELRWSDVNLYRAAADVLKTDDKVNFPAGPDDLGTYSGYVLGAGATWVPPRGFRVIITTSDGQRLQVYTDVWKTSYVSFAGGLVAFDGTNVRFYNTTGADGFYYWRYWI